MTLNGPKTSDKKLDFVGLFQEQDLVLEVMRVGLIGVLDLMRIELQSSNT